MSFIIQNASPRNFSALDELFGQNLDEKKNNEIKQKYLPGGETVHPSRCAALISMSALGTVIIEVTCK